MEELNKLERVQKMVSLLHCNGLVSSPTDSDSVRFIADLLLLLVQPCGELDMGMKSCLISQYMPKISEAFLNEASKCLIQEDGHQEENQHSGRQENFADSKVSPKLDSASLRLNDEVVATIRLDAMERANSTLEDFCRSYFMFHGLDVSNPRLIFNFLPVLSFVESYIYQLDGLNEKIVYAKALGGPGLRHGNNKEGQLGLIANMMTVFETDPFNKLICLLESHSLLTERIREELRFGEEYWMLERKLCSALSNNEEISVEDVIQAAHLKSFDYRVLNLLLYQLRGDEVNDLHMEFLSISEFLVEVSDDLFDYEEDVVENNFNILRMFGRIFGPSKAPAMMAKYITEAEERYEHLMKALDPELARNYRKRCEEATQEGGRSSKHSLGTWNIPALITDEESYRSSVGKGM